MKKLLLFPFVIIQMLILVSCSGGGGGGGTTGGTATLQWSAPATDVEGTAINVAGYKIYYGTESGNYTDSIDAGNVNTYTVSGLQQGVTYYFAVTAYDSSGVESDPTDEQTKQL